MHTKKIRPLVNYTAGRHSKSMPAFTRLGKIEGIENPAVWATYSVIAPCCMERMTSEINLSKWLLSSAALGLTFTYGATS